MSTNTMSIDTLTHLSLIKISGSDSEQFLQGQLTSDVSKLDKTWQYAGYCSPKGRLLGLLQIWRAANDFYALISADLVDDVIKRLRMFVLRSKVNIEFLEGTRVLGVHKHHLLSAVQDEFPLSDAQKSVTMSKHGDLVQFGNAASPSSFALIINQRVLLLGYNLTTKSQIIVDNGDNSWAAADINEGLPRVNAQTADLFIPQMLNLELLGGISFKKGCYTGQEIVARMHYLGRLKQRMFICDLEQDNDSQSADSPPLEPGQKAYADVEFSKPVATIVSIDSRNKVALAVIRLDNIAQPLHIAKDCRLKVRAVQAYDIPELQSA
jgi:folate-binding protein YgfZ